MTTIPVLSVPGPVVKNEFTFVVRMSQKQSSFQRMVMSFELQRFLYFLWAIQIIRDTERREGGQQSVT